MSGSFTGMGSTRANILTPAGETLLFHKDNCTLVADMDWTVKTFLQGVLRHSTCGMTFYPIPSLPCWLKTAERNEETCSSGLT